jgi:hypothetical protein
VTAEDQQVQVDHARTPALRRAAAEREFQGLERSQEGERACFGIGTGRYVESGHRVQEVRLIGHPDRCRAIQRRHLAQPHSRQRGECTSGIGQRPVGVADVRAQADVRANPFGQPRLAIG